MYKPLEDVIKSLIHWQILTIEQIKKTIKYYNSLLTKGK